MKLRDYQQDCVDTVIRHMKKSTAPVCIEAATGAGKSLIVAAIAAWLSEISDKKILCLAPSKELIEQNHEKYLATGNDASIFCASAGQKCFRHPVVFCSPLTTKNAIDEIAVMPISAVILDECHTLTPTVLEIIRAIQEHNPNLRIIGLTATPYRMGTGYIYALDIDGDAASPTKEPFFSRLLYRITAPTLIDRGYLTPPLVLDAGDFGDLPDDEAEAEQMIEQSSLTAKIIASIVAASVDCKGVMIFASTVKHAEDIMAMLPKGDCRLVTANTPTKERIETIAMFKAMMFKYLVNVSVLTTGFDAPHVDFIAVLRPTESRGLFQQIIGRGTRLFEGKQFFIVADCAGNIARHGLEEGNLFNPELQPIAETKMAHAQIRICPVCNYENHEKFFLNPKTKKLESTLRRCQARHPVEGIENPVLSSHFVRCSHYFKSKECKHCEAENDITARQCWNCKEQLIDPDDKLQHPTKQTIFYHDVTSIEEMPHRSAAGNDCVKLLINGKYLKYYPIHTEFGKNDYADYQARGTPIRFAVDTGGKFPKIELFY